jgi:hypothetical protein
MSGEPGSRARSGGRGGCGDLLVRNGPRGVSDPLRCYARVIGVTGQAAIGRANQGAVLVEGLEGTGAR